MGARTNDGKDTPAVLPTRATLSPLSHLFDMFCVIGMGISPFIYNGMHAYCFPRGDGVGRRGLMERKFCNIQSPRLFITFGDE